MTNKVRSAKPIEEVRDAKGHRLCDMLYDDKSDHVDVIFKHGPEKYTISFEEMLLLYRRIKRRNKSS